MSNPNTSNAVTTKPTTPVKPPVTKAVKPPKAPKLSLNELIATLHANHDQLADLFEATPGRQHPLGGTPTQIADVAEKIRNASRDLTVAAVRVMREAKKGGVGSAEKKAAKLAKKIARREAMIVKAVAALEAMKKEQANG